MHLEAIDSLKRFGALQFKDDLPEIIHPQEIKREYVGEGGVWFLRAQNVRPLRIDPTNQVLISHSDAATLTRNEIEPDDVLITRTGANRGECAIYDRDERAIASSHTFIVRPKTIDPQFLTVFLNSHFGKSQIDKGVYGAAQPEVAPYYLRNIWLPEVSLILISRIKSSFTASKSSKVQSETKHKEAEDTLLAALGLADWEPPEPLSYTARASDTFAAGRLDAQYFSSKFDELPERLSASAARMETIRDIRSHNARGLQPEYVPEGDVYVVNSRHILEARIDYDDLERTTTEWLKINERARLQSGDILTYTTGAKIGRTAHFALSDPAVASNHVNILRLSKGNPEYVAFVMNSLVGRLQTDRHLSGTAQPELYPRDIDKFIVPFIPDGIQSQITASLRESEKSRAQARQFLEAAKRAVEIAIENGEAAALAFLDQAEGTS